MSRKSAHNRTAKTIPGDVEIERPIVIAGLACLYSMLLLLLNRVALPPPLRVRSYRVGALLWSAGFFGVMSALTVVPQLKRLL